MLSVNAKLYEGQYGTSSDTGKLIHVNITAEENSKNAYDIKNKEIILLIDVSASMSSSMKSVKSSLLALRDFLVGKTPEEMEELSPEQRDSLIRNINIRLVTFSNTAKEIWSPESEDSFERVVTGMRSELLTNMGDGMKLCFRKIDPDLFTWLIVMTDGESNEGPCQTLKSFQRLVKKTPEKTKIVTLGYGNKFKPEILNEIGTFVYVENSEMIPVVLGNLATEILSSFGFDCIITNNNDTTDINNYDILSDDTIIIPSESNTKLRHKDLVGNPNIGPLCYGKSYDYIYSISDNNNDDINIMIIYKDIHENTEYVIYIDINMDNDNNTPIPTSRIRTLYFESEMKRITYRLYKSLQKDSRNDIISKLRYFEKMLTEWDKYSEAELACEKLRYIMEQIRENINKRDHATNTTLNHAISSGYTCVTDNTDTLLSTTCYYMVSPLVNN
jgi:hypothetical protein